MTESVLKCCMMCHKKVYSFVVKCGCGSQDFFPDIEEETHTDEVSNVYVLLPDGKKEYIAKQILHVFKPKIGGFTTAGYPILQDELVSK